MASLTGNDATLTPRTGKPEAGHVELKGDQAIDDPYMIIDRKAEKKLLWKLDLHVLPPLMVLFMLSFLDRTNIGNAYAQLHFHVPS